MASHPPHPHQLPESLVIRGSRPDDHRALARLAELDGGRVLDGERVLVAEVDGDLRAAMPIDSGEPVADPFHPTAAVLEVLKLRAQQLRDDHPAGRRGLRWRLTGLHRPAGRRPAMAPATPGNASLMIPRDRG
jgi:hypothetical protein